MAAPEPPRRERQKPKHIDLSGALATNRRGPELQPLVTDTTTSCIALFHDPCLTAFAELGVFRLNGTQAIISFFDRHHQTFAAEAFRTPPQGDVEKQYGRRSFRANSICNRIISGAKGELCTISDLQEDERLQAFAKERKWRSFAGVPLCDQKGESIGVYCVLGSEPRPGGLAPEEIQFMQEMSKTVMEYLEAKMSTNLKRKGARMVRGLGGFVEGEATLRNWSDALEGDSSFMDLPGVQEGRINKELQSTPENSNQTREARLQADIVKVFAKASNIIREAVEVEGVLFLDASVREFGSRVGKEVSEPPILTNSSGTISEPSDDDVPDSGSRRSSVCKVLGFSTSAHSSINGHEVPAELTAIPQNYLQKLLQKYPLGQMFHFLDDGTLVGEALTTNTAEPSPVSPWMSRKRGPLQGQSEFYSSEDVEDSADVKEVSSRVKRRRNIATMLQDMFPGATSVAFVPMFDGHKNRWYAGGFVWTKSPSRTFSVESELSYLRVFALIAMAEVARLHACNSESTKTDILGSISHELRSPLHGVINNVELLRETKLDIEQGDILRTIDVSNQTLLDTIDHVLDYSRINNQIARPKTRHARAGSTGRNPDYNIHLDRLAEEVVESILSGWNYRYRTGASGAATPPSKPIQVILDIESGDWLFRAHPGAFRRILMNLLGNSLKFTSTGWIRIRLSQESSRGANDATHRTAYLTVSDTGKGISKEYMDKRLFTPFAQEDEFVPGTGLGLSLVREMVNALGGDVKVDSKVGRGTTVTVSVPLPPPQGDDEKETVFEANIEELTGKRIFFQGLDTVLPSRGARFHGHDRQHRSELQLLRGICREQLKMDIITKDSLQSSGPVDFTICGNTPIPDGEMLTDSHLAGGPHILVRHDPSIPMIHQCCVGEQAVALTHPIGPRKLAQALVDSRVRFKEISTHFKLGENEKTESDPTRMPIDISPITSPLFSHAMSGPDKDKEVAPAADTESNPLAPKSETKDKNFATAVVAPSSPEKASLGATETVSKPLGIFSRNNGGSLAVGAKTTLEKSASTAGAAAAASPKHILVVDDSETNCRILEAFLKKLGHTSSRAMNGKEALEMYTKRPREFSCILTDISMPVMDGLESTRLIRTFESENLRGQQPVTIITLSGMEEGQVKEKALACGVDLHLMKPVKVSDIQRTLEKFRLM